MADTSGVDTKQTIEALVAAEVTAYRAAIASARLRLAKADAHEDECKLSEANAHQTNIEARLETRRAKAALDKQLAAAPATARFEAPAAEGGGDDAT